MVRITGLFHPLINGVYWGFNPLILTFDPNLLGHPSTTQPSSCSSFIPEGKNTWLTDPRWGIVQSLYKKPMHGTCANVLLPWCIFGTTGFGVDRYLIYWQLGSWFQKKYRELEDQGKIYHMDRMGIPYLSHLLSKRYTPEV